jgi:simple sugar transport system substrate-binding protein
MKAKFLATAAVAALVFGTGIASAQDKPGAGLTMYMQMGGNPGDGATLARQTGAKQAADALGVQLNEQFSPGRRKP